MLKSFIRGMLAKAGYTVVNRRWQYAADGLFTVHNDHFRQDVIATCFCLGGVL